MRRFIELIGLDFGSTTSCALIARAPLLKNTLTGKIERGPLEIVFRSESVFTPFKNGEIDGEKLHSYLDLWFQKLSPDLLKTGGAIITGLAAQKNNAPEIIKQVESRLSDCLTAVADQPHYESWLAFMGSSSELSLQNPTTAFLNIDIGGGTTNFALGQGGEVHSCDFMWIGARHIQFEVGTFRITHVTEKAQETLKKLGILDKTELSPSEVQKILNHEIKILEEKVRSYEKSVITFSGGVGELIYSAIQGKPLPSQTYYGDLGGELAQAILDSPLLSKDLKTHVPSQKGRATVYGLALHSTQVSGATSFISHENLLPLKNLPIFGEISPNYLNILPLLETAKKSPIGGCLQLRFAFENLEEIKKFSIIFSQALRTSQFPLLLPLILLTSKNTGKTLGGYITDWGRNPYSLLILDEVEVQKTARFASIGRIRNGVLPVSFYSFSS